MILSGLGLVARFKAEKAKRQKGEGKRKKRVEKQAIEEDICEQCQVEASKAKTYFQFPDRYNSIGSKVSSGYGSFELSTSHHQEIESSGELVTIGTGEGHCVFVNNTYYTVGLHKENTSSSSHYFRKHVLHREVGANGDTETVVFSLEGSPDHYITTNAHKQLELNYLSNEPSLESPDERFFLVYTTNTNQKIIQPIKFKGFYLHHIDDRLDVTRFDINFRAPEEYFFQFDTVPDISQIVPEQEPVHVCTHGRIQELNNRMSSWDTLTCQKTNNKNDKKNKNVLSNLFMSCVSTKSQTIVT